MVNNSSKLGRVYSWAMEKLSPSSVKVSQKSIYIHIIKIYINK